MPDTAPTPPANPAGAGDIAGLSPNEVEIASRPEQVPMDDDASGMEGEDPDEHSPGE